MPFTASHAAAVLPIPRRQLPLAALVAGTVVPDLPYYIPYAGGSDFLHTVPGIVATGGLIGTAVYVLWEALFAPLLLDLAPAGVRGRLAAIGWTPTRLGARSVRFWLSIWVAASIGALTHVIWDSFTHRQGWVVQQVGLLTETLAGLPLYTWGQYLSSLVGAVVVAVALLLWYRRTPSVPAPPARPALPRGPAITILVGVPAVVGLAVLIWAQGRYAGEPDTWRIAVEVSATRALRAFVAVLLLLGVAHRLRRADRDPQSPQPVSARG